MSEHGDMLVKDGHEHFPKPELGEPYLLTPGPLTTAIEVKRAMLRDWGSWDKDFRERRRERKWSRHVGRWWK